MNLVVNHRLQLKPCLKKEILYKNTCRRTDGKLGEIKPVFSRNSCLKYPTSTYVVTICIQTQHSCRVFVCRNTKRYFASAESAMVSDHLQSACFPPLLYNDVVGLNYQLGTVQRASALLIVLIILLHTDFRVVSAVHTNSKTNTLLMFQRDHHRVRTDSCLNSCQ